MKAVRARLSYANVVSTIALVLVVGGASAIAATELPKSSVGTVQLKANAVTAAKIKSGAVSSGEIADGAVGGAQLGGGAVSTGKLRDGAVTGNKLADGAVAGSKLASGSVTADKLEPGVLPVGVARVTQRLVGTESVPFPTNGSSPEVQYHFNNPTFTQPAGEDGLYAGAITASFPATCKAPREFIAYLLEENPHALTGFQIVAKALGEDENGTGELTLTTPFGAADHGATTLVAPPAPLSRTLSVRLERTICGTGSVPGATATATGAQVDVIGIR